MNPTRKYFLKLLAFTVVFFAIAKIWDIAVVWRPYLLLLAAIWLVLAIVPILGRPLHLLWTAYLKRTEQGPRFFQGLGLFLLVVAFYRLRYLAGFDVLQISGASAIDALPQGDYRWWALAGGVSLLVGLISPVARLAFGPWMKLAHVIQYVVSRVILSVTFVCVVLPLGLLAKIVGKRFLVRGPDPEASSYWLTRSAAEWEAESYSRQF